MVVKKGIDQLYQNFATSKLSISIVLRWYVVIVIFVKIVIHYFSHIHENLAIWLLTLAFFGLYTVWASIYYLRNRGNNNSKKVFYLQLFIDTAGVSLAYYLNGNMDSDLYLNYALPILLVLEHLEKPYTILFHYLLISLVFFFTLNLIDISCKCGFSYEVFHAFIPRFTLSFLLLSYVILQRMVNSST